MSRRLLPLTTCLFLLFPTFLSYAAKVKPETSTGSSQELGQVNVPLTERNSFSEQGLRGRWAVLSVPDPAQDGVSPVVVQKVSSFIGAGKWQGNLKLVGGKLRNDSTKSVKAVQLEWAITPQEDADDVLLRGVMPPFAAQLSPNEVRSMEFPVVNFKNVSRSLAVDGALHGDFLMRLSVSAILFEDGSVWKRGEVFSLLMRARYTLTATDGGCSGTGCQAQYYWPYVSCISNPNTKCDRSPCNEYGCNCGNENCPPPHD